MLRVTVQTGERFEAGISEPTFSISLRPVTIHNRYLVAPKGDRFLLLGSLRKATIPPTTIVLNWNAELGQ
jgi:hypothetical protein